MIPYFDFVEEQPTITSQPWCMIVSNRPNEEDEIVLSRGMAINVVILPREEAHTPDRAS